MLTCAAWIAVVVAAAPMPPEQVEAWREDLEYLRTQLPAHHLNAFHTITAEEWERRVAELQDALPEIDEDQAKVRLMALVASIGDAHTSVRPAFDDTVYPLVFKAFADGMHVVGELDLGMDAVGAQLTAIDGQPIDDVMERIATIISHDNLEQVREAGPRMLSHPGVLRGLGIALQPDAASYTLQRDERRWSVQGTATSGVSARDWHTAAAPAGATAPLYRTDVSRAYWWRAIDDARVIYVAYNACREDPTRPFQAFAQEVLASLDSGEAQRLVIDLRNNSGGNSAIARPLIEGLGGRLWAAEKGRVIVLIGRRTYSSGMMNAIQLQQRAGAVLIGEPTGGKPNSYGEIKSFTLPRTGFEVYYCTKYFRQAGGDPPSVEPDVRVETSSADWFAWRDPVMDAARTYQP